MILTLKEDFFYFKMICSRVFKKCLNSSKKFCGETISQAIFQLVFEVEKWLLNENLSVLYLTFSKYWCLRFLKILFVSQRGIRRSLFLFWPWFWLFFRRGFNGTNRLIFVNCGLFCQFRFFSFLLSTFNKIFNESVVKNNNNNNNYYYYDGTLSLNVLNNPVINSLSHFFLLQSF